jgi:hypothetical protein
MKERLALLLVASVVMASVVLAMSPSAAAQWPSYFGPGTFYQYPYGQNSAASGWNYWTNNRVYRPLGHPFQLAWTTGGGNDHWSASNSWDNPFYFPAYGYNALFCRWRYWEDGAPSIYPVTCQGHA